MHDRKKKKMAMTTMTTTTMLAAQSKPDGSQFETASTVTTHDSLASIKDEPKEELECFLSSGTLTPVSDGSVSDITTSEERDATSFTSEHGTSEHKPLSKSTQSTLPSFSSESDSRADNILSLVDLYQSCRIGDVDVLSNTEAISQLFDSLSRDKASPFPLSLSPEGDTMFHLVSRHGHLECMKILIKAFPEKRLLQVDNEAGESILDVAYNTEIYRFVEEMEVRLEWLEKQRQSNGAAGPILQWISMQEAKRASQWIRSNPVHAVHQLLKSVKDPLGHSLLHYACLFDLPTVLADLAERVQLKAPNESSLMSTPSSMSGNTLLHESARFLSFQATAYLIEKYDYMVSIKNTRGETAFDLSNKKMRRWMKQALDAQKSGSKASLFSSSASLSYESLTSPTRAMKRRPERGATGSSLASTRSSRLIGLHAKSHELPKKRGRGRPPKAGSAEPPAPLKYGPSMKHAIKSKPTGAKSAAAASSPMPHLRQLDPKVRDKSSGRSQLHLHASRGNLEAVQRLIELGASVDSQDNAGYTPLHEAALKGHLPVVALLLDHGADPNIQSILEGDTALHDASENEHTDVVRLLLSRGADKQLQNRNGMVPDVTALLGPSPVLPDAVETHAKRKRGRRPKRPAETAMAVDPEPGSLQPLPVVEAASSQRAQERQEATAAAASSLIPASQSSYESLHRWRRRSSSLSEFGLKERQLFSSGDSLTSNMSDASQLSEYPSSVMMMMMMMNGPPKLAAKLRHRRLSTSAN